MKNSSKIKPGDIFKIIHENEVRYFQFFFNDSEYLSGDLIWVFNHKEKTTDLDIVTKSGYNFYLYTTIKAGIKMHLFEKIGHSPIPQEMKFTPKFRWTDNDLTQEVNDWYILQGNNKVYKGKKLNNDEKKLPFASINFPKGAVEDMIKGYKSFMKNSNFPYF